MKRFSILLPTINVCVFLLVAFAFLLAHGGWTGDAASDSIGTDTISQPSDVGSVFFNRWNFFGNRESVFTRAFLYMNVPAFGIARLILLVVGIFWLEFQGPHPLGLSYASYSLMLAVPLSLLQWFGIGLLLDRLRRRSMA